MPAIVAASIITAGAGIGATVYSAKSAKKNQQRAAAAENVALDKSIAAQREATAAAIQHEKDLDKIRHDEWQREQDDARAQHEWYQAALEPYRQASSGALGSLGELIARLGGGPGLTAGLNPNALFSPSASPGVEKAPTMVGAPRPGVSGPWSPSELVRTARVPTSTSRSRALASAPLPGFTGGAGAGADEAVPTAIVDAAARIADIIKNLPSTARPDYVTYPG